MVFALIRARVCSLRLRITANRQAVSFAVRNIAPLACALDAAGLIHHTTKQGLNNPYFAVICMDVGAAAGGSRVKPLPPALPGGLGR